MLHNEGSGLEPIGSFKFPVSLEHVVVLLEETIFSSIEHAFFIKEFEQGRSLDVLKEINAILVIHKWNLVPLNIFFFVLLLLQSEHMLIELLLKLLISIVNAKLFKGIVLENFKSKNIKKSNEFQFLILFGFKLFINIVINS